LVVDDDPVVRETAVEMFRSLGLTVYDAYNGHDALRMLVAHPGISVLFTDVRMPGMTGGELAAEAHRIRPEVKIVFTSGYVGEAPLPNLPLVKKPLRLQQLQAFRYGQGPAGNA
jgi:CheY-like chemotaxis protein